MKIEDILEEFTIPFKPISRPGTVKRKALEYLGKQLGEKLTKKDLKLVESKANKIKKSTIKADRHVNHQLTKQVDLIKEIE